MNLETNMQIWTREAAAHGYEGFLVVKDPKRGIDRIFLNDSADFETALENCEDNSIEVISEVWL